VTIDIPNTRGTDISIVSIVLPTGYVQWRHLPGYWRRPDGSCTIGVALRRPPSVRRQATVFTGAIKACADSKSRWSAPVFRESVYRPIQYLGPWLAEVTR
jgi:hypothetical protein